jgi:hypothetical protein
MGYATRLPIVAAALVLASSAHAFTYGNQGTTSSYSGQGASSYGSTLTDPGSQIRNYGGVDLSTPGTASKSPTEGFSFRFDSGPFGSKRNNLAPPRWSTDPLYLERGGE